MPSSFNSNSWLISPSCPRMWLQIKSDFPINFPRRLRIRVWIGFEFPVNFSQAYSNLNVFSNSDFQLTFPRRPWIWVKFEFPINVPRGALEFEFPVHSPQTPLNRNSNSQSISQKATWNQISRAFPPGLLELKFPRTHWILIPGSFPSGLLELFFQVQFEFRARFS